MSRRRAAIAVATSLVAAGVIPLTMGLASAAACPAWTDAAGDADAIPSAADPIGFFLEDDLDIVKAAVTADATTVTATTTVTKLGEFGPSSALADKFETTVKIGGTAIVLQVIRDFTDVTADTGTITFAVLNGSTAKPATGSVDLAKSTLTVVAKKTDIATLLAKPVTGLTFDGLSTQAYAFYTTAITGPVNANAPRSLDTAAAPATATFVESCGAGSSDPAPTGSASGGPTGSPTAAPTGSSSPTPTGSPSGTPSPTPTGTPGAFEEAPYALPRAGCQLFTDAPSDAPPTVSGPAAFPNDPDLDISSVSVKTTATQLIALIKVATLGDLPAKPVNGDQFQFEFKLGGKTFNYAAGRVDQVAGGASVAPNRAQVNTAAEPKLKYTSAFDKTKNTVSFLIDRAALESVAGVPAPVGTVLTGVKAVTKGYLVNQSLAADTAQATAAADQVYTVGDNVCFFPPAAKMEWLGEDTVTGQYGDLVEAAVALSSDDDNPLEGRAVTFTLGTAKVTGTTDADGVADVFLPALAAGTAKVTAAFAGDVDNYKTALDYAVAVTAEATKLTLAVTKAGTARTVTATLVDDDKPKANPIAGQTLTVLVNGKKAGTVKTDAKGKAVWKTAKIGQTVKFTLAAVPGKYATASAQQKLA